LDAVSLLAVLLRFRAELYLPDSLPSGSVPLATLLALRLVNADPLQYFSVLEDRCTHQHIFENTIYW
jgi:hypothetical protein